MGKARIAIVGGDDREFILAGELARQGYDIHLAALPPELPRKRKISLPQEAVRVCRQSSCQWPALKGI